MKIFDLPTPALIADRDSIGENMRRMNAILQGKRVRLRPHYKSHKCAALALRQIASGAVGMTCAKLSEAEDLIFSGISDVLIANQVVEPAKIARLAQLAGMCRLSVCVDDADNARALSRAAVFAGTVIRCLVEYDIGMNRCGVRTKEAVLALATAISDLPGLEFCGIQAYAGYASHRLSLEERARMTRENEREVAALVAYLQQNGVRARTVSGGSTGTAALKAEGGIYTELQAGSYLFMDSTYGKLNLPFQSALSVLSTVVSRNDGAVILDAGVKGLGADQDDPLILDRGGNPATGQCVLNEEHLKLYGSRWEPHIGEKAFVIPGHCCSTVNLYDNLYLYSGDTIVERLPISARGKSQ